MKETVMDGTSMSHTNLSMRIITFTPDRFFVPPPTPSKRVVLIHLDVDRL